MHFILTVGLCWRLLMSLTTKTYRKVVSLPGEFTRAEIKPLDEKSKAASLSIIWNMDNYRSYEQIREIRLNDCSDGIIKNYKCVSFHHNQHPVVKKNYYFISHIKLKKISWMQAADLCKQIGGYLPSFTSLQEQKYWCLELRLVYT